MFVQATSPNGAMIGKVAYVEKDGGSGRMLQVNAVPRVDVVLMVLSVLVKLVISQE
eukprot:NODE_17682_length_931_cov_3.289801.p6 GENE.NODE_17682_length_931_cov_3.289801~~NODE_17682_length_931_cov_3.289801.p6  ORF type:complete len:56 (-),score=6.74 NODE_17682_length_931_cov_3.289801:562-729(-)